MRDDGGVHWCRGNNGHDNKNADLIMAVNDVIMGPNGQRFVIMDSLGSGTLSF